MKESIEVVFGSNAFYILDEMFTSMYRGEAIIPIAPFFDIKLPEYVIKVKTVDKQKHLEVYNQSLEKCGIKYILDQCHNTIKFENYGIDVHKDISNPSLTKLEINKLDDIVVHAYIWSTYLFNLHADIIPCSKRYILDKKRRKSVIKEYHLTDDFLRDKIVFSELKDFDYTNIVNVPKIYTTFDICKKLTKKYTDFDKAEILVPFKEFVVALEDDKIYYCKYINGKLAIIEYEKGEKMIGAIIDTQKSEGSEYRYMLTPFDFYKYNDKSVDHKFIGGYGVSVVVMTLYFYTRFAVKKVLVKKEKPTRKKQLASNITEAKKEVENQKDEIIILPKVQKVYSYSITETVKSGQIRPRKKPVYFKEQWQKQGFYRRTKTGKVVWVRPTTCVRHKETRSKSQHIILDVSKV